MSGTRAGVDSAFEAGRAAWPGLDLDLTRFAAHVIAVDEASLALHGADMYLAAACAADVPGAVALFDAELLSSARGAVQVIDANPAFVDEAIQRLRSTLFVGENPRIETYAGRGPLRAWIGIAAARTALMMRRSQQRAREVPADGDDWAGALAMISTSDPELELLKRQYATAFAAALRDSVARLEPRARAALRMSFVDALSIDEIGTAYGVHRATAARWIQRACEDLAVHARTLLSERLSMSPTELDRMTALVRSQLDVSVSQLLPSLE